MIGQYTINIPEIFQVFDSNNIVQSKLLTFVKKTRMLLVALNFACLEINIISWCCYATFSFGIQNKCYKS